MNWQLLCGFTLLFTLIFSSCELLTTNPDENDLFTISCGAEEISTTEKRRYSSVSEKDFFLTGTESRDSLVVHSGEYSIALNKERQFGFSVSIEDIEPGDRFRMSIFRRSSEGQGKLIASNDDFWYPAVVVAGPDGSGWERLELDFYIPPTSNSDEFKIYAWNNQEDFVYFDDLLIEKLDPNITAEYEAQSIYLYINDEDMAKLDQIRIQAMNDGILRTNDDSWVKALFFYGDKMLKAKVRFKGDWTDHLKGRKWSFRVKLKEGSWNGMRTFNIQSPKSRNFLNEWFAHKVFQSEDVLTTRYGFVPVKLNNENLGLFAYEEHFEKQLVESRERREGPILKLSEDHFWEANLHKMENTVPFIPAAKVLPFKQSKLIKDTTLLKKFILAQDIVYDYHQLDKDVTELIDQEKWTRYIALMDLMKGYHGSRWHNQRFYYNPVLAQIEPIAYDLYFDKEVPQFMRTMLLGQIDEWSFTQDMEAHSSNRNLMTDSIFMTKYLKALERYSRPDFISGHLDSMSTEIDSLQKELNKEFPYYEFNKDFYRVSAEQVDKDRKALSAGMYTELNGVSLRGRDDYAPDYIETIPPLYLGVYRTDASNLNIQNNYVDSIEIIGLKKFEGGSIEFSKRETLAGFINNTRQSTDIATKNELGDRLLFKVVGHEEILEAEILPWPSPATYSIKRPSLNIPDEHFVVKDNEIILRDSIRKISEKVVIPQGYDLIIPAGSEIDLINEAFILSYSALQVRGSKDAPARVYSSDATGLGITILSADRPSNVEHMIYENMDAFRFGDWTLTGALNFYESEVSLDQVAFKSNRCEDALNIIRSDFIVQNCSFEDVYSDAFDSDFSRGQLLNTTFDRIGNDAIDFSGSVVDISACRMDDIGDKGVSGGEGSTLTVRNCVVTRANIGIASKDRSILNTESCTINESRYGLVVFQKKPEYGPAFIDAQDLKWNNVAEPMLVEKGSKVQLGKKEILGKAKKVAELFY